MTYDPSQVAFIDTETTGLDPEDDYIWEIAVIVDARWAKAMYEAMMGGPA